MHEKFLLAALELAQKGQGFCAPNPCVGALAVRNGVIIAQAWHHGAGTPHAEQLVLTQFASQTSGVTLYITLEPCNHWGRTPPCVDAIIKHGIEEVIFSYLDPNPIVVKNNSTNKLRAQGIRVSHVPIAAITDFYLSYSQWTITHKPRVTVKMAQSLDGKIAGPHGARMHLSNSLCHDMTHHMRAASDVILTTARTIVQDNPKINVRLNNTEQSKPVAIIDSHLIIKNEAAIFSSAKHCLIYHLNESHSKAYPNSTFFTMPNKNGKMDLSAVITHLGVLGYHDVWVEAGGALFTALHLEGLVDRTYLYIVPQNLGQNALSAWQHPGIFERQHTVSWRVMEDNVIACLDWQGN